MSSSSSSYDNDNIIDPAQLTILDNIITDVVKRFHELEGLDITNTSLTTTLSSSTKSNSGQRSTSSKTSTSSSVHNFHNITQSKELYAELLRVVLRDICSVPIKVQVPESLKVNNNIRINSNTTDDNDEENNLYVDITTDWESEAIDKGWAKYEVRDTSINNTNTTEHAARRSRKNNDVETMTTTVRSSSPERSVFSSEQQKSSHYYIRKLATEITNTIASLKDYIPTVDKPLEDFIHEFSSILHLIYNVSQNNLLQNIEENMNIIRKLQTNLLHQSSIPDDNYGPEKTTTTSLSSSSHQIGSPSIGSKRSVDGHSTPNSSTTTTTTPSSGGRFGISALFPALGRSPSRSASTNRTPSSTTAVTTTITSAPTVPFMSDTSFERRFTTASQSLRTVCGITTDIIQRWPQILQILQQICDTFIQLSEHYLQQSTLCTERYDSVCTMLQEAIRDKDTLDTKLIHAVAKLQNVNEKQLTLAEALSACLDFIMVNNKNNLTTSSPQYQSMNKQTKEFIELTELRKTLLTQIDTLTTDQKNCICQKTLLVSLSDLVLCAREYAIISCIRAQISLQRALMQSLFCADSVSIEWLVSLIEWSGSEEKKRLIAEEEIRIKQDKLQTQMQYFGNTAPHSQADLMEQIKEMEQIIQNSENSLSHILSLCSDIAKYSLANMPLELRQTVLQRIQLLINNVDLSIPFDIDMFSNRLRTSAAKAASGFANDGGTNSGTSTSSTPTSLSSFMDTNSVHKGAFKLRSYSSVRHMNLRTLYIPIKENIVWGSAFLGQDISNNNKHQISETNKIKCLLLARTALKPLMPIISQPSVTNLSHSNEYSTSLFQTNTGDHNSTSLVPTYGTLFDPLSIMAPGPPLPELETGDEEMNTTDTSTNSSNKRNRSTVAQEKTVSSSGNKRARRDNDYEENEEEDADNDDNNEEEEEEDDDYDYRRKSSRQDTSLSSTSPRYSGLKRARPYGGDGPGGSYTSGNKHNKLPTVHIPDDEDDDGNQTDGTVDSEASESGACIIM